MTNFDLCFPIRDEIYRRVGIQMGFIATRSGLLRYSDHTHLFIDPAEEEERKRRMKKRRKKKKKEGNKGEEEEEDDGVIKEP